MLAHACNPNTWEDEQEKCWEFKFNLGYSVRLFPENLQKKSLDAHGMMTMET